MIMPHAAVSPRRLPGLLVLGVLIPACGLATQSVGCLHVFDATSYSDKPDLGGLGLEPAYVFEPDRWWPPGEQRDDLPDPRAAEHWMGQIAAQRGRVILDVERWPLVGDESAVRESIRRYATIAAWLRAAGYRGALGYYNVVPIWNGDPAILHASSPAFRQWQAHDDMMRPLLDQVDALYPSFYTDTADIKSWVELADAHIAEARRISKGKPIYIFLWPQFHESNRALALKFLPADSWSAELRWAGEHADGVVIWGGWDAVHHRRFRWEEAAEWWVATKRFLDMHPSCTKPGAAKVSAR
jgi:hypothetical protein